MNYLGYGKLSSFVKALSNKAIVNVQMIEKGTGTSYGIIHKYSEIVVTQI